MAYWLYCQSCKEWSKSATPMSKDKICPYCSKAFTAQPYINPALDQEAAEKSKELKEEIQVLDVAAIPAKPAISEEKELPKTSPTPEIMEAKEEPTNESVTDEETSDTEDSSEVNNEEDSNEIPDETTEEAGEEEEPAEEERPEEWDEIEPSETSDNPDTPEAAKKPKMTRTHETYLEKKRRSKNT